MKRFFNLLFGFFLFALMLQSCKDEADVDLGQIKIETELKRFDRAFYLSDTANFGETLSQLSQDYPPFFSSKAEPIFWWNQRNEELQKNLFAISEASFGDMDRQEAEINAILKRYYHYFGSEDTMEVYTYISRLDFNYPVVFSSPYVFIGLDLYLGEAGKEYYASLPQYLQFNRQPAFLSRDLAFALAEAQVPAPKNGSLLDEMVYRGKVLQLTSLLMAKPSEDILMRYPIHKYQFCVDHEKDMWIYFIENELLFSSSDAVKRRYMEVAPFSKFRTEIDAETPGQVGWWFGLQIVKSWLEESPDMPLDTWLREMDGRKVLKLSSYKP